MIEIPDVTLNNGVRMPSLGLGVFTLPEDETKTAVAAALDCGYRLIDTAAMYQNEAAVGEAVRESSVPREEIFVTSKLWNGDHGYDEALRAFDASMDRLGLDYLDLYLIHWPLVTDSRIEDTWRAFEKLYADGRVKAIGVSNFFTHHLDQLLASATVSPAVLQIELHPTFTQNELRNYARRHNIQVESWFPLGGRASGQRLLDLPKLTSIAAKYDKTAAQIVLRWHTQMGLVPLPGSSNPAHIKENADIFDITLTDEEVAAIADMDTGIRLGADPATLDRR